MIISKNRANNAITGSSPFTPAAGCSQQDSRQAERITRPACLLLASRHALAWRLIIGCSIVHEEMFMKTNISS
ncbi:MAG: hypothetical protein E6X17_03025 [Sporomusaceae bacterium]|nr:hypothetical protein [Sporomusaceae bacterium]